MKQSSGGGNKTAFANEKNTTKTVNTARGSWPPRGDAITDSRFNKRSSPESTILNTVMNETNTERNGQTEMLNANVKHAEKDTPKQLVSQPTEIIEPERTSGGGAVNSEMVASHSMNLLDESSIYIFKMMKGLTANAPDPETKKYEPEVVNAACNCAGRIYQLLRLKLDAIKVQEKIK